MIDIRKFYNQHMKKLYYYVPPCPECGSMMTGRIVKEYTFQSDADWCLDEALRHGEIIVSEPDPEDIDMAMCLECGHSWHAAMGYKWLTISQINEQKKLRMTRELLQEINIQRSQVNAIGAKRSIFNWCKTKHFHKK